MFTTRQKDPDGQRPGRQGSSSGQLQHDIIDLICVCVCCSAAKNSKSFVSRLFPSFVSCCFVSSEKPDKQNENSCVFLLNNAKEKQDKYYGID
ncbi:hypothetical protein BaRGS_00010544 [Batillaria attramentaria]|uniref:Uncharacterized protein n=1 Tax=Batillaria attramentaria TaxID=370345 RepID=A0ABD0LFD1_9CAEN